MDSGVTCIVSIHGIGFQQPPSIDIAGYADDLHAHLHEHLGDLLSDDPTRQSYQQGESVPIYVQSSYQPSSSEPRSREEGMKRLGTWRDGNLSEIDPTGADLVCDGASIAHLALVYSELEEEDVQGVPTLNALILSQLRGYHGSNFHLLKKLWKDIHTELPPLLKKLWAAELHPKRSSWKQSGKQNVLNTPSLSVRQDRDVQTVLRKSRYLLRQNKQRVREDPNETPAILKQIRNDATSYISDNKLRQRVCSFVLDALLRLACRDDVSWLVINSHSGGTMIALDALRQLPLFIAAKIRAFITVGTPLHTYTADLLSWREDIGRLQMIKPWLNFWDRNDLVAGPIESSLNQLLGAKPTSAQLAGSYLRHHPETGEKWPLPVKDIEVDNVASIPHGEGLVAHNYWDNKQQFIPMLAHILKQ